MNFLRSCIVRVVKLNSIFWLKLNKFNNSNIHSFINSFKYIPNLSCIPINNKLIKLKDLNLDTNSLSIKIEYSQSII